MTRLDFLKGHREFIVGARLSSAALAQFMFDNAHHFGFGSGFAGPDLELTGTLLYEHLEAAD